MFQCHYKYTTVLPINIFDERLLLTTLQEKSWSIKIDIELHESGLIQKTVLRNHGFYDISRVHSILLIKNIIKLLVLNIFLLIKNIKLFK